MRDLYTMNSDKGEGVQNYGNLADSTSFVYGPKKVAPAVDTPAALGGGLALHAQLQRVAAAAVRVRPPRL